MAHNFRIFILFNFYANRRDEADGRRRKKKLPTNRLALADSSIFKLIINFSKRNEMKRKETKRNDAWQILISIFGTFFLEFLFMRKWRAQYTRVHTFHILRHNLDSISAKWDVPSGTCCPPLAFSLSLCFDRYTTNHWIALCPAWALNTRDRQTTVLSLARPRCKSEGSERRDGKKQK